MRIIGLDLGSKTGWAVWDDGLEACGTWRLKNDPADMSVRYGDFKRRLVDLTREGDVIAYEIVHRHLGTQAAHLYGGFQAILLMRAHELDAQVLSITVQDVKRLAAGKGNADKAAVMAAAWAQGFHLLCDGGKMDDNAADACYIALCAANMAEVDQWAAGTANQPWRPWPAYALCAPPPRALAGGRTTRPPRWSGRSRNCAAVPRKTRDWRRG
jgi:Holliday junction resolvasome RuvABC endonuclease subunit